MNHERYRLMLGKIYNASELELVKERANCRQLAVEFNKHAGTYLSNNDDKAYDAYMKVRRKFLPNVDESCIIEQGFHADYGYNIHGGKNGLMSFNTTILDSVDVTIGEHVFLGPNVVITDASHPIDPTVRTEQFGTISKGITIDDNVWICSNATICQGVHIGKNVVIAAGTVVRHDIPDNCVVAGPNAEIIKSIEQLISITGQIQQ